jgi:hypothetical protein
VRKEMKKEWITWFDTVSEEEERAFSAPTPIEEISFSAAQCLQDFVSFS